MEYWNKDDFATTGFTAAKTKKWSVNVTAAANGLSTNGLPLSGSSGTATEFAG